MNINIVKASNLEAPSVVFEDIGVGEGFVFLDQPDDLMIKTESDHYRDMGMLATGDPEEESERHFDREEREDTLCRVVSVKVMWK